MHLSALEYPDSVNSYRFSDPLYRYNLILYADGAYVEDSTTEGRAVYQVTTSGSDRFLGHIQKTGFNSWS